MNDDYTDYLIDELIDRQVKELKEEPPEGDPAEAEVWCDPAEWLDAAAAEMGQA